MNKNKRPSMNSVFKRISPLLALICILASACGNDRAAMLNEMDRTEKILQSIEPSSVSISYKPEVYAEKVLLQTEAAALRFRINGIDKIEHGKFAEEQKAAQQQIDALMLKAVKLRSKIARIQVIDATQTQLDELQKRINEVKEKARVSTGDLKAKYENAVVDLEQRLSEVSNRIVELTSHLKDSSDELWESITATSEKAWATTKAKIKAALDALSGEL